MSVASANDPLSVCTGQINQTLGNIFNQVRQLMDAAAELWGSAANDERQISAKDLAQLRPVIEQQLMATGAFGCGGGVIVEPCCLVDREMHLEWWYLADGNKTLPLRPNFDRSRENFYDYTNMPWYAKPREAGSGNVEGPYVDLYGTNMYVLTFTMPVVVGGHFVGVAGLDLSLHNVEKMLTRSLMCLEHDAALISADGRVIASNTAELMVGELIGKRLDLLRLQRVSLSLQESEAGWSLVQLPAQRR